MDLKLIDKVCQYMYSKMVNLDEISEILEVYGLEESGVKASPDFLKKLFPAFDENEQRARLNLVFTISREKY